MYHPRSDILSKVQGRVREQTPSAADAGDAASRRSQLKTQPKKQAAAVRSAREAHSPHGCCLADNGLLLVHVHAHDFHDFVGCHGPVAVADGRDGVHDVMDHVSIRHDCVCHLCHLILLVDRRAAGKEGPAA